MNKESLKSFLLPLLKQSASWFEIDLTISIFGVKVLHFHFPPVDDPKSNEEVKKVEPSKSK